MPAMAGATWSPILPEMKGKFHWAIVQ